MAKSTRNTGKEWSRSGIKELNELAENHTPTRVIGMKLHPSPGAIYSKAADDPPRLPNRGSYRSERDFRAGNESSVRYNVQ
jgi:hypothetical protein